MTWFLPYVLFLIQTLEKYLKAISAFSDFISVYILVTTNMTLLKTEKSDATLLFLI